MKPLYDNVLISIDREYNDVIGETGLLLVSMFAEGEHKRIFGYVEGVPEKLSNKRTNYWLDPGFPQPSAYRDHERAKREASLDATLAETAYNPGLYVNEFLPLNETTDIDIENGDRVYFDYKSIKSSRYVKYEDQKFFYSIPYSELMCRVRDGDITTLNNFVFLEKIFDPSLEDIATENGTVKGRTKQIGDITLVIQVSDEHMAQRGKVAHCPPKELKGFTPRMSKGDIVAFKRTWGLENNIEGKTYYTMNAKAIVMVNDDPAEGYVRIKPEKNEYNGRIYLRDDDFTESQCGTFDGFRCIFNPGEAVLEQGDYIVQTNQVVAFLGDGTSARMNIKRHQV